jgi:hypothetical protein
VTREPCRGCGAIEGHVVGCLVILATRRARRSLGVRVYERQQRLRRTTDFHALVWRTT